MIYNANTQTDVKINNQKIILKLLQEKGPLTRADIAKCMNSSKPTVSKNVDELMQENKVWEVGKDDNLVGKKGILIDLNAAYGYVLGIDMSKGRFKLTLCNLRMIYKDDFDASLNDFFLEEGLKLNGVRLEQCINAFIQREGIKSHQIHQVVIAYPGIVKQDGTTFSMEKRHEVFLRMLLDHIKSLGIIQVLIKNDLNLGVLAEKTFGPFSRSRHLCLFSGDVGVGLGIVIDYQLYEGDRYAAGEIGFVLPIMGEKGYQSLESRIGLNGLFLRYKESFQEVVTYEKLCQKIVDQETNAMSLYHSVIEELAFTMASIASILDIQTILVTGRLFQLKEKMLDDLNKKIIEWMPFETKVYKAIVENKALKGACLVGVDAIMERMVQVKD